MGGLKYDDGLHLLMFLIQKTIQQDAISTHSKAIPDFSKSKVNIILKIPSALLTANCFSSDWITRSEKR